MDLSASHPGPVSASLFQLGQVGADDLHRVLALARRTALHHLVADVLGEVPVGADQGRRPTRGSSPRPVPPWSAAARRGTRTANPSGLDCGHCRPASAAGRTPRCRSRWGRCRRPAGPTCDEHRLDLGVLLHDVPGDADPLARLRPARNSAGTYRRTQMFPSSSSGMNSPPSNGNRATVTATTPANTAKREPADAAGTSASCRR